MIAVGLFMKLFLTFAKIGFFTFGGGYAMIAIIEDICVERYGWITHEELMDMTVIAESTPGPIAVNCATYVGYKQGGFVGSLASTFGVILPSFAVIYLISSVLDNFLELTVIANAFRGIKIAVGILILDAALNMMKKMPKKPFPRAVVVACFGVMLVTDLLSRRISTVSLMVLAAAVSVAMTAVKGPAPRKGGEGK